MPHGTLTLRVHRNGAAGRSQVEIVCVQCVLRVRCCGPTTQSSTQLRTGGRCSHNSERWTATVTQPRRDEGKRRQRKCRCRGSRKLLGRKLWLWMSRKGGDDGRQLLRWVVGRSGVGQADCDAHMDGPDRLWMQNSRGTAAKRGRERGNLRGRYGGTAATGTSCGTEACFGGRALTHSSPAATMSSPRRTARPCCGG